jgi:hypothetical protein
LHTEIKINNTMSKNFCPIHSFFYSTRQCPYCQQDHLANVLKHTGKQEDIKVANEDKRISKEDLIRLKEKFSK